MSQLKHSNRSHDFPHLLATLTLLLLLVSPLCAQEWINPGPFGGDITALAISPVDTNLVLAGSSGGGIWRSQDYGEWWEHSSEGMATNFHDQYGAYEKVNRIIFHPTDPNRVYACSAGALYCSNDGGVSWDEVHFEGVNDADYRDIHFDPVDPEIMFVVSSRLWKSMDGGETWSFNPLFQGRQLGFLAMAPDDHEHLVTTWGTQNGSLWASNDLGESWYEVAENFQAERLVFNPNDSRHWVAIRHWFGLYWELYHTFDEGRTWHVGAQPSGYFRVDDIQVGADDNLYAVDINGFYRSDNFGESFTRTLDAQSTQSFAINSSNVSSMFIGSRNTVYRTYNACEVVELCETGIINTRCGTIASNPQLQSVLFAGGRGGNRQGLWRSIDSGISWTRSKLDPCNTIAYDPSDVATVYYGGSTVQRSGDLGLHWDTIYGGSGYSIAVNPENNQVLLLGTLYQLLKSVDAGDSWYEIDYGNNHNQNIRGLHWSSGTIAWFGLDGLYKSVDLGETWIRYTFEQSNFIENLYFMDEQGIIAFSDRYNVVLFDIESEEVVYIPAPMEESTIKCLAVIDEQTFVVAGNQSIYYTENQGSEWMLVADQLLYPNLLHYDEGIDRLMVGTYSQGIFFKDNFIANLDVNDDNQALRESLPQLGSICAFPNPSNSSVQIRLTVPLNDNVHEVSIFNILGQQIRRIPLSHELATMRLLTWDCRNDGGYPVAAGMYLIKAGESPVVKVLLTK